MESLPHMAENLWTIRTRRTRVHLRSVLSATVRSIVRLFVFPSISWIFKGLICSSGIQYRVSRYRITSSGIFREKRERQTAPGGQDSILVAWMKHSRNRSYSYCYLSVPVKWLIDSRSILNKNEAIKMPRMRLNLKERWNTFLVWKNTLTAWNTSIAGCPKSPFWPFSPGNPWKDK